MSTAKKHTFVVFAPDNTETGTLEKRLSVREKHIADANAATDAGQLKLGGVMLSPESITGGEKKMVGSVLIIEAESLEEVQNKIRSDVYYANGVWDLDKLVILPFVPALGSTKIV